MKKASCEPPNSPYPLGTLASAEPAAVGQRLGFHCAPAVHRDDGLIQTLRLNCQYREGSMSGIG